MDSQSKAGKLVVRKVKLAHVQKSFFPPPQQLREKMVLLKNLHPPTEGVRHEQAETTAVMDGQKLGCGMLYVTES